MNFSAKMFVCSKNVVPLHRQIKNDGRSLILGYGVMVTQQILVLFFLVRVRVAQLHLWRQKFSRRKYCRPLVWAMV